MNETESTCLDYITECGIRGMEIKQIDQYYKEQGTSEEMIKNAHKAITTLLEL